MIKMKIQTEVYRKETMDYLYLSLKEIREMKEDLAAKDIELILCPKIEYFDDSIPPLQYDNTLNPTKLLY